MNHSLGSVGRASRKENRMRKQELRARFVYRNNATLRTSRDYAARERAVCTTAKSESTFSVNFNFFFLLPPPSRGREKHSQAKSEVRRKTRKTIRKLGIAIESHNLCPGNQSVIARYGVRNA